MTAREALARYPAPVQDQLLHLARRMHDGQCRAVVSFSDRLDAQRLARAFDLSLDAEPVLGCRFVDRPWRPYWERLPRAKQTPVLSMCEAENEGSLRTWLETPLDASAGIQVHACLFRGVRERLAVKVSHESSDGGGLVDYLGLVSTIYRELRRNPAYVPSRAPGGRPGQGEVFRNVGFRRLLRGCLRFSFPGPGVDFPPEKLGAPAFGARRVGREGFARIKEYCRSHEVTVNEVILAAFYRAQFRMLSSPPAAVLTVPIPINLRRYLPADSTWSVCNLSAVFFGGARNQDLDRLVLDVRRLMEFARSEAPWLGQAALLELVFFLPYALVKPLFERSILHQIASGRIHPYVANHGIIDTGRFDFGDAKVSDFDTWSPIPCHTLPIFSAYSVFDTLGITVVTRDQPNGHKAERLLDAFFRELPGQGCPAGLQDRGAA